MSITNENPEDSLTALIESPEDRFAELAEPFESRLGKTVVPTKNVSRAAAEARLKAPVIAPPKKAHRNTGNLSAPPAIAKNNRWEAQLVVTSTQAIADSGSVWIKGQTKVGELLLIRFDGATDSLKDGKVTVNGEPLPLDEKGALLAAVAKASVPYAGEMVVKRIQQHMGMFCERAAHYEG
ncbi:MAG: hypothetical protein H7338_07975 [Candidatus Sericytochromatia bacterium]|nr:hypothetical protein [Candidatus Sericytochromatia bacterium]